VDVGGVINRELFGDMAGRPLRQWHPEFALTGRVLTSWAKCSFPTPDAERFFVERGCSARLRIPRTGDCAPVLTRGSVVITSRGGDEEGFYTIGGIEDVSDQTVLSASRKEFRSHESL
jgi:hypothetical protein